MNPKSLNNLKPFQKGISGNPKGRPPKKKYTRGNHPNSRSNLKSWESGQSGNPKGRRKLEFFETWGEQKKGGNPPEEYQFKKGQSGNPKGRPRLTEEELRERIDTKNQNIAFQVMMRGTTSHKKAIIFESVIERLKSEP